MVCLWHKAMFRVHHHRENGRGQSSFADVQENDCFGLVLCKVHFRYTAHDFGLETSYHRYVQNQTSPERNICIILQIIIFCIYHTPTAYKSKISLGKHLGLARSRFFVGHIIIIIKGIYIAQVRQGHKCTYAAPTLTSSVKVQIEHFGWSKSAMHQNRCLFVASIHWY